MGEIKDQIKELEYLLTLDVLHDEQKQEIEQALSLMREVKEYKEDANKIKTKFVNKSENKNPTYAKEGDSGFDLRANEGGTLKSWYIKIFRKKISSYRTLFRTTRRL
jgi:hypothetical protein